MNTNYNNVTKEIEIEYKRMEQDLLTFKNNLFKNVKIKYNNKVNNIKNCENILDKYGTELKSILVEYNNNNLLEYAIIF